MTAPLDALEHARLVVSRDALLSVAYAARLIGGREARAWLRRSVVVKTVAGQERVVWGDVLAAIDRENGIGAPGAAPGPARPKFRLADRR